MPVYAFAPKSDNRPTHGDYAVRLGDTLQSILQQNQQKAALEKQEALKQQYANASPIEKQKILDQMSPELGIKYAHQQAQEAFNQQKLLQQEQKNSQLQELLSSIQQRAQGGGRGVTPENIAPEIPGITPMRGQPAPTQTPSEISAANQPQQRFQQGLNIRPEEILFASSINPATGRALGDIAKMQQKEEMFDRETQRQINKEERERIREYSKPYENLEPLRRNLSKLEQAKKLIQNEKVSFDENVFRGIFNAALEVKGKGEIAELLKTPAQQKLFSLLKDSLKTKEVGGSNPSTREVLIAMSAIPSNLKGKEANLYIIDNMINDAKVSYEKGRIVNKLSGNPNLKYSDFISQVNQHVEPLQTQLDNEFDLQEMKNSALSYISGRKPKEGYVFMLNPETGEPREVLARDVQAAKAAGGILLNE